MLLLCVACVGGGAWGGGGLRCLSPSPQVIRDDGVAFMLPSLCSFSYVCAERLFSQRRFAFIFLFFFSPVPIYILTNVCWSSFQTKRWKDWAHNQPPPALPPFIVYPIVRWLSMRLCDLMTFGLFSGLCTGWCASCECAYLLSAYYLFHFISLKPSVRCMRTVCMELHSITQYSLSLSYHHRCTLCPVCVNTSTKYVPHFVPTIRSDVVCTGFFRFCVLPGAQAPMPCCFKLKFE